MISFLKLRYDCSYSFMSIPGMELYNVSSVLVQDQTAMRYMQARLGHIHDCYNE